MNKELYKLHNKFNLIVFGLILNAIAILNLLNNNFIFFIIFFFTSCLLDLINYKTEEENKYSRMAQWFKYLFTYISFRFKYRDKINITHITLFVFICLLALFNHYKKEQIYILSDKFIITYIIILMITINKF